MLAYPIENEKYLKMLRQQHDSLNQQVNKLSEEVQQNDSNVILSGLESEISAAKSNLNEYEAKV